MHGPQPPRGRPPTPRAGPAGGNRATPAPPRDPPRVTRAGARIPSVPATSPLAAGNPGGSHRRPGASLSGATLPGWSYYGSIKLIPPPCHRVPPDLVQKYQNHPSPVAFPAAQAAYPPNRTLTQASCLSPGPPTPSPGLPGPDRTWKSARENSFVVARWRAISVTVPNPARVLFKERAGDAAQCQNSGAVHACPPPQTIHFPRSRVAR